MILPGAGRIWRAERSLTFKETYALLDQCSAEQLDLYNKLPYYLVQCQIQCIKNWKVRTAILGEVTFPDNLGETKRSIV